MLSDILGTDADTVSTDIEKNAERSMLYQAIGSLESRERFIMELRFDSEREEGAHPKGGGGPNRDFAVAYFPDWKSGLSAVCTMTLKKMNE